MGSVGTFEGIPLKIMGVAWFDEKYVDENGHEQNVHVANMSETFSIKWGGETAELPAANRQIIDYLHNEVLPTLNPVYGADGSIVEWKASESSGLSCKQWIQTTVMNGAFGSGHPIIPNNDADNYSKWILDGQNDVIELASINLENSNVQQAVANYFQNLQVGDVVQAKVSLTHGGFGPHTFILDKKTESGIWLYDSNWSIDYDETVRYHYLSYEEMSDWGAMTGYRIQEL